jgi:hypothetical protein
MNDVKFSRSGWVDCRREELLAELTRLQAENAQLAALLREAIPKHGKREAAPPGDPSLVVRGTGTSTLSSQQKVHLFQSLFRGRTDVYPLRWESRKSGKSGYAPACANEWRAGICEKPRVRCADCAHRVLLPLDDQVIYGVIVLFVQNLAVPPRRL